LGAGMVVSLGCGSRRGFCHKLSESVSPPHSCRAATKFHCETAPPPDSLADSTFRL